MKPYKYEPTTKLPDVKWSAIDAAKGEDETVQGLWRLVDGHSVYIGPCDILGVLGWKSIGEVINGMGIVPVVDAHDLDACCAIEGCDWRRADIGRPGK